MNQEEIGHFYSALRDTRIEAVESLIKAHLERRQSPIEILKEGLIGAMGIIGQEFKEGRIWVPEVLLAARNMHGGIEMLRPELLKARLAPRGKLLIGTVKGDFHDIGKNLVAMMMTGAGYQVIDLGTDVPKERFLEAVSGERPDLVGLSALLTTTMLEMKDLIRTIRRTFSNPPRIIVGGAPVTRRFAEEIESDGYGEDAVSAVEVANRLVSSGGPP